MNLAGADSGESVRAAAERLRGRLQTPLPGPSPRHQKRAAAAAKSSCAVPAVTGTVRGFASNDPLRAAGPSIDAAARFKLK